MKFCAETLLTLMFQSLPMRNIHRRYNMDIFKRFYNGEMCREEAIRQLKNDEKKKRNFLFVIGIVLFPLSIIWFFFALNVYFDVQCIEVLACSILVTSASWLISAICISNKFRSFPDYGKWLDDYVQTTDGFSALHELEKLEKQLKKRSKILLVVNSISFTIKKDMVE